MYTADTLCNVFLFNLEANGELHYINKIVL